MQRRSAQQGSLTTVVTEPLLQATPALAKSRKVSHVAPDYFDAYQAPAPGSQALLVARLTLGPGNNFDFAAAPDDQLAKKPKARRPNVYSGITQDTSDDRYLTYIGISDRGPVSVRASSHIPLMDSVFALEDWTCSLFLGLGAACPRVL